MATPATGPIARPKQRLGILLAASETFQDVVGASSEAEALDHVYYNFVRRTKLTPDEVIPQRPFAIISARDDDDWSLDVNVLQAAGELTISFEFPPDVADDGVAIDSPEALDDFTEKVGHIILEMSQLSQQPRLDGSWHWHIRNWTQRMAPDLMSWVDNPDDEFYGAVYKVSWHG